MGTGTQSRAVASAETLPIAQASLVQAGLFPNPNFGQTGAFYFPLSGQGGAIAADFLISETLNGFFAAPFKTQIAKAQKYQAGIDIANQAFGLAQQTHLQFDRLAWLVRSRRIERQIAEAYKQAADDAQAKVRAGAVTLVDVDRAAIQCEDARCLARRDQIEYEGAATQLNWLMGVQSAPQWVLPEQRPGSAAGNAATFHIAVPGRNGAQISHGFPSGVVRPSDRQRDGDARKAGDLSADDDRF